MKNIISIIPKWEAITVYRTFRALVKLLLALFVLCSNVKPSVINLILFSSSVYEEKMSITMCVSGHKFKKPSISTLKSLIQSFNSFCHHSFFEVEHADKNYFFYQRSYGYGQLNSLFVYLKLCKYFRTAEIMNERLYVFYAFCGWI